ncbi:MAG: hypothetical protein AAF202_12400, partial [Pseudomonadota bacterium]
FTKALESLESLLAERLSQLDGNDAVSHFQSGNATQLAVIDVDDDGSFELMAPTFDDQLVAHLNIFKYNPVLKRFEPIQSPE